MHARFPLGHKYDRDLGVIPDPIIPISILTTYGYYQSYDFVVDAGADCCILPKTVAGDLGIDIESLPKTSFKGIEGGITIAYLAKITMKITNTPIEVICALSSNEKSPFILGRKDIFSRFNILFDNKNKQIRFTSL